MSGIEIVLAVILGIIVNEFTDVSPWLARKLVAWSAKLRYSSTMRRDVRTEELIALINARPGNLLKLGTGLRFAVGALALRLRRFLSREPQFEDQLSRAKPIASRLTDDGVPAERFFLRDMSDFSVRLATAQDIGLLGVTLSRMLSLHGNEMARRLRAGSRIRVIILDPVGPGASQAGLRLPVGVEDYFAQQLEQTIEKVRVLKMRYRQGQLDVRLVPGMPPIGLSILDPATVDGRVYVEIYTTEWLRDHPVFCLQARRDGHYYFDYVEQFESLWEDARPLWPVQNA